MQPRRGLIRSQRVAIAHGVEGVDTVVDMHLVPARQAPGSSRSTYAASPPKLCAPKNVVIMANFMGDLHVASDPVMLRLPTIVIRRLRARPASGPNTRLQSCV